MGVIEMEGRREGVGLMENQMREDGVG